MKIYGARLRLTPKEVDIIKLFRRGKVDLKEPVKEKEALPKILLLDIETAPLEAFIWRLKTDYVNHKMLSRSNWFMLSWSAKWLFDSEMMNDVLTPEEAVEEDDERIALSMWQLIDEADIVISHNGKNFDHKMLNMRWLVHGYMPPTPYKIIDTFQVAKNNFALPSYSLGYIAKELGFGGKLAHEGNGMWKKCMAGDEEALKNMVSYNDRDVEVLEDVYLLFRPWIKNHPNIGLFTESQEPCCATCGSKEIEPDGLYHTSVSKFQTFRCRDCGSLSRQRQNALPKELRKKLLSGIPGTL